MISWENVSLQSRNLTIPRSKHGEMRHVSLNDRVMEILRNLPSRMKSPWVFTSSNGVTPMDAQNFVRRVFLPAMREAGIKDFRWHDLRHTFASRLIMAGADLKSVQELMGHKTITLTMKYAHLSPGHRMAAVQLLCSASGSVRAENRTDTTTDTSQKERATESP